MSENKFDIHEARNLAAHWALWLALWWTLSFGSTIVSLHYPFLGLFQWLFAIWSLMWLTRKLKGYANEVDECGFMRRLWLSWTTSMALLTTMLQYIYFRFIDQGRTMSAINELMSREDMREALKGLLGGEDWEAQLELMSNITQSQLTATMLIMNLTAAFVAAVVATIFSCPDRMKTEQHRKE